MTIPLFPEEFEVATTGDLLRARLAVVLAAPLARSRPDRIERVLSRWADRYPAASAETVRRDRHAVCQASGRCRSQEGCLHRSLAVATASRLRRRSVTWCSGFATEPFRAHAWVEVAGRPVLEPAEVTTYAVTMRVATAPMTAAGPPDDDAATHDPEPDEDGLEPPPASVRQLVGLAHGHGRTFALASGIGLAAAGATLLIPELASRFVSGERITLPGAGAVAALVALVVMAGALSAAQYLLVQRIGESVVRRARTGLAEHLFLLPVREYDRRSTGDLLSRVANDTSRLRVGLLQASVAVTSGAPLVIGACVLMLLTDPVLLGSALALCLVTFALALLTSRLVRDASLRAQHSLGRLTSTMQRDLVGVRTIRAANATGAERRRLVEAVDATWRSALRVASVQAAFTPLVNVGLQLSAIGVLVIGSLRAASGALPLDELVRFALLLLVMISPLSQMMSATSQVGESVAALARVNEVLDLPTEDALDVPVPMSATRPADATETPALELRGISFGYQRHRFGTAPEDLDVADVLHGLDLVVPRGARVAVVGPSGAGKSTVLQLVERFYEPRAGQILLHGRDVRDLTREELRTAVAYVEQDAPVISGTLRENLTLGLPEVADDACWQVLRAVNLEHLATSRDGGLDSRVGEAGAALSGGERQRVAVARALLSPAGLILLDEATANLDSANERVVADLLRAAHGSRTVVVVAHRLASVVDADTIHVLEHGRRVASGSHDALVREVPLYRDLAREQGLVPSDPDPRSPSTNRRQERSAP